MQPLRDWTPRTLRQASDFCVRAFDTGASKDPGHQETRARVLDADERALWRPCCVTLGESSALWSLIYPLNNEGIDFSGPFGSTLTTLGFLLPSPCPLSGPRTHTVAMAERQSSGNPDATSVLPQATGIGGPQTLGRQQLDFETQLKTKQEKEARPETKGKQTPVRN